MTAAFLVEPDELERCASNLSNAARKVAEALSSLERQAQLLRSQWTGAAQLAYDDAQRQWQTAMGELNGIAADAGACADMAAQRYRAAEQSNARRWWIG